MKKLALMTLTLALLSACNTVHGVGKDVSAAGDAVSESATRVQQKM